MSSCGKVLKALADNAHTFECKENFNLKDMINDIRELTDKLNKLILCASTISAYDGYYSTLFNIDKKFLEHGDLIFNYMIEKISDDLDIGIEINGYHICKKHNSGQNAYYQESCKKCVPTKLLLSW